MLIVGSGAQQCMKVAPEVISAARDASIKLLVLDTATACQKYNGLASSRPVVGAMHLTC